MPLSSVITYSFLWTLPEVGVLLPSRGWGVSKVAVVVTVVTRLGPNGRLPDVRNSNLTYGTPITLLGSLPNPYGPSYPGHPRPIRKP